MSGLARYMVRRLLLLVFVVIGITLVTFAIANVIPGDPARMAAGLDAGPEQIEAMRKLMGLDKPLYIQYLTYMKNLVRGDMGISTQTRAPVRVELAARLAASIELVGTSLLMLILVSIPVGVYVAVHKFSPSSMVARVMTFVGSGMPVFWLGLLLQLLLAMKLGWLPVDGRLPATWPRPPTVTGLFVLDSLLAGRVDTALMSLKHLLLPAATLAMARSAMMIRLTAASLSDVLDMDYIRTARAKGLMERAVIYKHALRNSLIPVTTLIGLQLGHMLGGTVLIEAIFSWPGLGSYMIFAINWLDYPAIMGGTLILAVTFAVTNLVVDVLYGVIDPRITRQ